MEELQDGATRKQLICSENGLSNIENEKREIAQIIPKIKIITCQYLGHFLLMKNLRLRLNEEFIDPLIIQWELLYQQF